MTLEIISTARLWALYAGRKEHSRKAYRYYCQFRPPMPGAIPRDGLVNIGDYDYPQSFNGISAWGFAEYSRELTEKEVHDYELAASSNNPLEYGEVV